MGYNIEIWDKKLKKVLMQFVSTILVNYSKKIFFVENTVKLIFYVKKNVGIGFSVKNHPFSAKNIFLENLTKKAHPNYISTRDAMLIFSVLSY